MLKRERARKLRSFSAAQPKKNDPNTIFTGIVITISIVAAAAAHIHSTNSKSSVNNKLLRLGHYRSLCNEARTTNGRIDNITYGDFNRKTQSQHVKCKCFLIWTLTSAVAVVAVAAIIYRLNYAKWCAMPIYYVKRSEQNRSTSTLFCRCKWDNIQDLTINGGHLNAHIEYINYIKYLQHSFFRSFVCSLCLAHRHRTNNEHWALWTHTPSSSG